MTLLKLTTFALLATAIGVAGWGVIKYSDFLTRLHKLSPKELEGLTLENIEGWSSKNWRIARYFWQRQYLGQDTQLNALGNSVRRLNIISVSIVLIAAMLMLFGGQ
ncbi:MAG TPA: hypothetical protein VIU93_12205 [Gallionellaceae bacterium]